MGSAFFVTDARLPTLPCASAYGERPSFNPPDGHPPHRLITTRERAGLAVLSEIALLGATLLLHDLHLFFIHATAIHPGLGQSSVNLFQVFCG